MGRVISKAVSPKPDELDASLEGYGQRGIMVISDAYSLDFFLCFLSLLFLYRKSRRAYAFYSVPNLFCLGTILNIIWRFFYVLHL